MSKSKLNLLMRLAPATRPQESFWLLNLTNKAGLVKFLFATSGNSSVVERDLAKVEVASSSLVSRSKIQEAKGSEAENQPLSFRLLTFKTAA
jgi:hypothetical protein